MRDGRSVMGRVEYCEPEDAGCQDCTDTGCGWRATLKQLDPEAEGRVLDDEARSLLCALVEGRGSLAVRGLLAAELVRWIALLVEEGADDDERAEG